MAYNFGAADEPAVESFNPALASKYVLQSFHILVYGGNAAILPISRSRGMLW
jgi:hypothetical protein